MKLAILGATGAVGREVLDCLHTKKIEPEEIRMLASARSAGKVMNTPFGSLTIQEVSPESFEGIDYAIFSAGGGTSKEWAPIATDAGCIVIDNSSAFRYEDGVPLVVPEINGEKALNAPLIANPNCVTAIGAVVLNPIHRAFGVKKLIASTYQSSSGAGQQGMTELLEGTKQSLNDENITNEVFAHPLPFNIIPRIDVLKENGYTKEEMKLVWETQKIIGDDSIDISCTCVRIPVLRAHCISMVMELAQPATPEQVRDLLKDAPGVEVRDDPENDVYPMPLTASGKYDVEVGRIRRNLVFGERGIELFVAGDQLLKGAALNAVQILEYILLHTTS